MIVKDLMNEKPGSIAPEASLADALKAMADNKSRHLVVIESEENVVGIFSDRDLAMVYDPVNMTQERWESVKVNQVMAKNPVSIGSQAPIGEAARLLLRHSVSSLPVVDNGILIGILTQREFVRHFAYGGN